jgi:hypothetical protein
MVIYVFLILAAALGARAGNLRRSHRHVPSDRVATAPTSPPVPAPTPFPNSFINDLPSLGPVPNTVPTCEYHRTLKRNHHRDHYKNNYNRVSCYRNKRMTPHT